MRKIVSFASTPNEAIKWSELGKYKRLSKEELYIYDFENIEEVHFIGSKKGENDYEIEETKWGIYINMEEAILLYICSWQRLIIWMKVFYNSQEQLFQHGLKIIIEYVYQKS